MLPSPTSPTSASLNFGKFQHQHQYSSTSVNGNAEVSTVQPVSLRQGRGARLSFLGGRKKDSVQSPPLPPPSSNGEPMMSPSTASGEFGKGHESAGGHGHRLSFFRAPPSFENQQPAYAVPSSVSNGTQQSNGPLTKSGTEGSDWVTDSGGGSRASHDTHAVSNAPSSDLIAKEREASGGAGTPKLGGMMKKRLSLLKLGKRTGRSNTMGAVSEE